MWGQICKMRGDIQSKAVEEAPFSVISMRQPQRMNVDIQTIFIVFLSILSFFRTRTVFNHRDERILQEKLEEAQISIQDKQDEQSKERDQVVTHQQPTSINIEELFHIDNQIFFYQYDLQRKFQQRVTQDNQKMRKIMEKNSFEVMGKYSNCKKGKVLTNDRLAPPYNQQCFSINPFKRERRALLLTNSEYEPQLRHHLQQLQEKEQKPNPMFQQALEVQVNPWRQNFQLWASQANNQPTFNCDDNKRMEEKSVDFLPKKASSKRRNICKSGNRKASQRLSEILTKWKSSSINNTQSLPLILRQQIKKKEEQLLVLKRLHASFTQQTSD